MDRLTEFFATVFEGCVERGMKLPFTVCTVAHNRSVLVLHVTGDGAAPDVLAQHFEDGGFALPINVMIVSRNNVAARATIEREDGGKVTTTFQ
jgi:hypothetical protein